MTSSNGGSGSSSPMIEELVNIGSAAAIEMYDVNSVPPELKKTTGYCALVAIWTGPRH